MMSIPGSHKIFFGVICAAALLIAVLGYLFPPQLATVASWLVLPPLHARFVGALYLYGAVFMVNCINARSQAEVRFALLMIAIWTGLLFIISVWSLEAFDFSRLPPWIWFISYTVYPLIALILAWQSRAQGTGTVPGDALPAWAQGFMIVQGFIVTTFAILLILTPGLMVTIWPWKITPLLAQTYGGPLLAYGLGSWQFAGRKTWAGARTPIPGMFVFTVGVFVASIIHRGLFSASELTDWAWFVFFGAATIFLSAMGLQAWKKT